MSNKVSALSMFLSRPLIITELGFKAVANVLSRNDLFSDVRQDALEARDGTPLANTRTASTRGSAAVIPVQGPLVRHADMFSEISGATSYSTLRKDFQAALDNPSVDTIMFAINSPGGEVTGCGELCDAIYAARGQKKILAYVDGMACSAAYWIASACDEIVISASGEAGSIGCMLGLLDDSAAMETAGVKEIRFVSSQSPNKNPDPTSDAGKEQYQQLVDDLAGVFVANVARNRGVSESFVLENFGQGGVMVGDRAVKAGLVDRVGNFEELLSQIEQRYQGAKRMSITMKALGLPDDATEEQVQTALDSVAKSASQKDSMLAALGASNVDEALGKIAGLNLAAAELATLRDEHAKAVTSAMQTEFRASLEKALGEKRLTLGQLTKVVPSLFDEAESEKAAKELGAVKSQDAKSLLDALCKAEITPSAVKRVGAFLSTQGPQVTDPAVEPETPADDKNDEISKAASEARAIMDRNKAKK